MHHKNKKIKTIILLSLFEAITFSSTFCTFHSVSDTSSIPFLRFLSSFRAITEFPFFKGRNLLPCPFLFVFLPSIYEVVWQIIAMNKRKILIGCATVLVAFIVFAVVMGVSLVRSYNKMVVLDEQVQAAWSQVENVYQRRADLIPNLVATVKGYATHEEETLTNVIEARAKASQTNINADNLTPETLQNFSKTQGELSSALSRLMVVVEKYPELKADKNFATLMTQLEGTENRIAVERKRFNETAATYNKFIRTFPNSVLATPFGFEKRAYFEADEAAQSAPKVEF